MQRKKLPIGIQTFAKIREDNAYYYVDKTRLALQLIEQGAHFFLSRPRRFGKSLFLDTLKELFEGNQALFTGLYAENNWDWPVKYPVLRFSFGGCVVQDVPDLQSRLDSHLQRYETQWQLRAVDQSHPERFRSLIQHLATQTGQRVVVLIDEYDKPILDRIEDREKATAIREVLKDFYSVIKDSDPYLRFVFLTGVSKFSKVSLFSGLNNLNDITVDTAYSAICGYTDEDVDTVFAPELPGLDRTEIRAWYNGYNWCGTSVYNPFDLLLLFQKRIFRPYWFETGTPTFLVKLLIERGFFTPQLACLYADDLLLSTFDVAHIASEALLWQTGYLTIFRREQPILGQWIYTLGYPNREVESSLNTSLLPALVGDMPQALRHRMRLIALLQAADVPAMRELFHAFFATIPHDWYRNNPIAQYEGYWASIFYSYFAALGLDIVLEDVTNQGRIDMAVRFGGHVYLFEFKVVELVPEGKALAQLQARNYADKYRARGEPIHLVGVEFSRESRNIVAFDVQTLE
ncbi:ATP-binding protein [Acidovorax sp. HDW3]|uniref:ATP-binding protein n=1 Tax=Acidovorax sp. HDW3 TaxID=2714923 RepID=UPI00140DD496|nr:ATP-binding protein [Acidovorax sp. HDW3]QIL45538.1 ATP-binding protein [Acidovorax sp. HDW3]